jgi:hypothetical protein
MVTSERPMLPLKMNVLHQTKNLNIYLKQVEVKLITNQSLQIKIPKLYDGCNLNTYINENEIGRSCSRQLNQLPKQTNLFVCNYNLRLFFGLQPPCLIGVTSL